MQQWYSQDREAVQTGRRGQSAGLSVTRCSIFGSDSARPGKCCHWNAVVSLPTDRSTSRGHETVFEVMNAQRTDRGTGSNRQNGSRSEGGRVLQDLVSWARTASLPDNEHAKGVWHRLHLHSTTGKLPTSRT